MLRELHIENVAVIERADLELGPGLNILTGETGAGKSILVDAMHAILGARASRELVRTGAEKAVVCATFDPDPCRDWCEENEIECDDELIIRRQITAEGKTSCRVCGVPVTTAQLRTLGALLLDIHGQNDGQHLLDEREHLRNLDRFGQLDPELARYREQYQAYQALCKERDTLSTYENEKELLTESLRRQIEELERAELKAGEEAELTERSDLLRNFEKLSEAVDQAYDLLAGRDDSAAALAGEALSEIERAANYAGELAPLPEAVKGAVFTLQDAAETLRDFRDSLDFSPEEYNELETRIALLNKLQRKYSRDEDALISYLDECREKLDGIQYAEERSAKLRRELDAGRVAVVTGFQGVDENGDVTTLGRGGSDTSAVALAAALKAAELIIYTDVDGIFSSDPRICQNAVRREVISYDDMLLLAQKGAQVLHDRSVALAQAGGVPITVRSCREGGAGSIVCETDEDISIVGVTQKKSDRSRLAAITAVGGALPSIEKEKIAVTALERAEITVFAVAAGERFMSFYVLRDDAERALQLVHDALIAAKE
mgnify:CR=1 FL=1